MTAFLQWMDDVSWPADETSCLFAIQKEGDDPSKGVLNKMT